MPNAQGQPVIHCTWPVTIPRGGRATGAQTLRLAAAIAHALPDCRLELRGPDGDRLLVGCRADCELSACELRLALIHALAAEGAGRFAGVEAFLRDAPPGVRHLGLGVYAYRSDCCFGCVLATSLDPFAILAAADQVLEGEDDPLACERIHMHADEDLGVTLLYTRHPAAADEERSADEELALRLATACLTEELVAELGPTRGRR